jgi:hypothetical protein
MGRTVEYRTWRHMLNRCYNEKVARYPAYGGRGIEVAKEWRGPGGFERWLEHIGTRPSPAHSLDRIDTNGHYEPGNVRWALPLQQTLTKRNTHRVVVNGEEMSLRQAALRSGVCYGTVYLRVIKRGEDIATALRP